MGGGGHGEGGGGGGGGDGGGTVLHSVALVLHSQPEPYHPSEHWHKPPTAHAPRPLHWLGHEGELQSTPRQWSWQTQTPLTQ